MYTIETLIVFIVIAVAAVISGISAVYNHIEGLRNDMKAFKQKTSDIQSEFQELMDILENKDFSKDWSEYLKWKETKDYVPNIEEMIHIKELKRLTKELDLLLINADSMVWKVLDKRIRAAGMSPYYSSHRRTLRESKAMQESHGVMIQQANSIKQQINAILKEIKNKKELVGVLKLYGISSKWIQP